MLLLRSTLAVVALLFFAASVSAVCVNEYDCMITANNTMYAQVCSIFLFFIVTLGYVLTYLFHTRLALLQML